MNLANSEALNNLIKSEGGGYPLWCVIRTATLCGVIDCIYLALDLPYVFPIDLAAALAGVWFAARDAQRAYR
jgi:hypothetical protein